MATGKYTEFIEGFLLGRDRGRSFDQVCGYVGESGSTPLAYGALAGVYETRGFPKASAFAEKLDVPVTGRMIELWHRRRHKYIRPKKESEGIHPSSRKFWKGEW